MVSDESVETPTFAHVATRRLESLLTRVALVLRAARGAVRRTRYNTNTQYTDHVFSNNQRLFTSCMSSCLCRTDTMTLFHVCILRFQGSACGNVFRSVCQSFCLREMGGCMMLLLSGCLVPCSFQSMVPREMMVLGWTLWVILRGCVIF